MYTPPFTVSAKAINLIARISAQIERYAIKLEQDDALRLRKANRPIFEHLPVENMVYTNQEAYYDAISASSARGDSGPFIDFMLKGILSTLLGHQGKSIEELKVLGLIRSNPHITAVKLAKELSVSARQAERIVASLKDKKVIVRRGANRNGWWEILN